VSDRVGCVVIGAGVVGLAVARRIALCGVETVVLERASRPGTVTSSRNSEVIHAGIYYTPGSLKARLCVEGKALLYRYCEARGVDHRRCGKLIVATGERQRGRLDDIATTASANGVDDLQLIDRDQARVLEPELECVAALLSPSTGIVDSHGLMLALQGDLEAAGGLLAVASPFDDGALEDTGFRLRTGGDSAWQIETDRVVNCAGLAAQEVAAGLRGFPARHIPPLHLAKGSYFGLGGRAPFSRLIYPVPENGGLGVHLTLDLGGRARFGPDVEWVDRVDYDVDATRAEGFYAAVRRYWPGLRDGALSPDYAGIRPKLARPGGASVDFCIQGPAEHGVNGLVNLFGIESPGLTSSLAIADYVAGLLGLV